MTLHVVIELAGTPRGKGRPRATVGHNGFARVYTDDKTVRYEAQLRYAAQQQMQGRTPTIMPVRVVVVARMQVAASWPRKKRAAALCGHLRPCTVPDADNLLKCLDALNGVIWQDDRQIVDARVLKLYAEAPSLTVDVKTIGPPELPAISPDTGPRNTDDLFAEASA